MYELLNASLHKQHFSFVVGWGGATNYTLYTVGSLVQWFPV